MKGAPAGTGRVSALVAALSSVRNMSLYTVPICIEYLIHCIEPPTLYSTEKYRIECIYGGFCIQQCIL